jgi:hypothetical protein
MLRVGIKSTAPGFDRAKMVRFLDLAATVIGIGSLRIYNLYTKLGEKKMVWRETIFHN